MATPCSVKAYGNAPTFLLDAVTECDRIPSAERDEVTICDLKSVHSSSVSRNMKSAGNRSRFLLTA
jgi:hypothetical protein